MLATVTSYQYGDSDLRYRGGHAHGGRQTVNVPFDAGQAVTLTGTDPDSPAPALNYAVRPSRATASSAAPPPT